MNQVRKFALTKDEDPDRTDSPNVAPPAAGRVFEGPCMNPALAQRFISFASLPYFIMFVYLFLYLLVYLYSPFNFALRVAKDVKNKSIFVFGDINHKQAFKVIKKLHKNMPDSIIGTLPPVDFSVNFDDLNVRTSF